MIDKEKYNWIPFYTELSNKLLQYKNNRSELKNKIELMYHNADIRIPKFDVNHDIIDIDPFTFFGIFNKRITDKHRIDLLKQVKILFDIKSETPENFDGIPVLNPLMATFYYFLGEGGREENDIDNLWTLYEDAINYADNKNPTDLDKVISDFDQVTKQKAVKWNITMALYWIRPYTFINLDGINRDYIKSIKELSNDLSPMLKRLPTGNKYIEICDRINDYISENKNVYTSFPEFSHFAWEESQKISWLYSDYDSGITEEKWSELLKDSSVFDEKRLSLMKQILESGGETTCTQLAQKYGMTFGYYNRLATTLAERVVNKTNCKLADDKKYWPVLFMGRNADKNKFIWKLREELETALSEIDLSNIKLKENQPVFWKISHGSENTGISDENKEIFLKRQVAVIYRYTKAKGQSNVTQGEDFMQNIKKGDYFYLCFANSIRLLGQFTSDEVVENPEIQDNWYERPYQIIAESKDLTPYKGKQKWWTPNDNSTCIKVDDLDLFETEILKPYFDKNVDDFILDMISDSNQVTAPENKTTYSKTDFLKDVYMSEKDYDTLSGLLKYKKNIILQGAPGVGKTYAAKKLAYSIMGEKDDNRIELVQFHQSYSYEDFVMGYKPSDNGFELKYGVFYKFCDKAANDPDRDYFFIIDEINRGNLSKIFGELLMLIEKDYRDTQIRTTYDDIHKFAVPKNLYIIGMMNTADRSLAMIDYALRRRFSFFEMEPKFDSDGFKNYQNELQSDVFNRVIEEIKLLNQKISEDTSLGKGFCIGHSYFCNRDKNDTRDITEWLSSIIEYDIIPMLEEYWFDDRDTLKMYSDNLRGVFENER